MSLLVTLDYKRSHIAKTQRSSVGKIRRTPGLAPAQYSFWFQSANYTGLAGGSINGPVYPTGYFNQWPFNTVAQAFLALQPFFTGPAPFPQYGTLKNNLLNEQHTWQFPASGGDAFGSTQNPFPFANVGNGWQINNLGNATEAFIALAKNVSLIPLPYFIFRIKTYSDPSAWFGGSGNFGIFVSGFTTPPNGLYYSTLRWNFQLVSQGILQPGQVIGPDSGTDNFDVNIPWPDTNPGDFTSAGNNILTGDYFIPFIGYWPGFGINDALLTLTYNGTPLKLGNVNYGS